MTSLDQEAAALQNATKAELNNILLNGTSAQSAAAQKLLRAQSLAQLAVAVGEFEKASQTFADLSNSLQTVIDAVKVNPFGNTLGKLNQLLGEANRIGEAIKDPEKLPALADDGASITFTLPVRTDEEDTPPAAPAAVSPPTAPAIGGVRPPPINSRKFADLKEEYQTYYDEAALRPESEATVTTMARRIIGFSDRYKAAGDPLGIPWYFIGCIHALESSCNFTNHLHNGDPLDARTTHVPAGCPTSGNPPFTWEESATDALTLKKYDGLSDWSLPRLLYRWEAYNGFGYRPREVATPYLWSCTSLYTKGRYVADGRFDANATSKQAGCVSILKTLVARGAVTL